MLVDKNLSSTVFGAKQNRDFWKRVFETGKTQSGARVLLSRWSWWKWCRRSPWKGAPR